MAMLEGSNQSEICNPKSESDGFVGLLCSRSHQIAPDCTTLHHFVWRGPEESGHALTSKPAGRSAVATRRGLPHNPVHPESAEFELN
jgi:hypothetical protein